jgi:hypothetical protein
VSFGSCGRPNCLASEEEFTAEIRSTQRKECYQKHFELRELGGENKVAAMLAFGAS